MTDTPQDSRSAEPGSVPFQVGGMPWGRRLANDIVVYGLGGSGAKVVSALLLPVFARLLTPADLGAIDLLTSVASIVTVVGGLGLEAAFIYYCGRATDQNERRVIASTALLIALLGTVAAASIALIGEPLLRAAIGSSRYSLAYVLIVSFVPLSLSASIVLDVLRLEFRSRAYAAVTWCSIVLTAVLAIVIVFTTGTGVAGWVMAQILVSALSMTVGIALVHRSLGARPSLAVLRKMLRYGLPLVPLGFTAWILTWSDRVVLLAFGYVANLGYYAVANRLAYVTLLGVGALSTAWAPFAITASRDPAHRQAFTTVFRVVGFGLLVLVCFTVMLTIVVVPLVFPGEYVAAIPAVPFLAGAVAAQGMGGLVSIGLLLTKRTGRLAMIGGVTAVSNVIFNLAAIPRLGIVGAGAATFGSSLVSLGVIYLVAERAYPIGYPAWRFAVASAATGLGVAAALVAYFALPGPAGLALAALVVAAACVLAGFALDVHGVVIGIWRQRGQELPRGRPAEEPVPPAGNGASTATAERSGSTTANAPDPKRVAP